MNWTCPATQSSGHGNRRRKRGISVTPADGFGIIHSRAARRRCGRRRTILLFYRRGDAYFAVTLTNSHDRLTTSDARPVFPGRYQFGGVRTGYDASPDGRSFLFLKFRQPRENLSQIMLLLNALTIDSLKSTTSAGR